MAGKSKMKLDGTAIKQFFVDHVEKIALTAGGICLAVLIYGTLGHEKQTRTASELVSAASNSERLINDRESAPPKTDVPSYAPSVEKVRAEIPIDSFVAEKPVCRPLMETGSLRGEPTYLTAVDLQTSYDYGAFPLAQEVPAATPEGEPRKIEGRMWVIVTGLVPTRAQHQAFKDAFANAQFHDPVLDTPKWIYYTVERAIVDPSQPNAEPKWEAVNLRQAMDGTKVWSAGGGDTKELVTDDLIEKPVVFPLPPLLGRMWDEHTIHPKLPLKKPAAKEGEAAANAAPAAEPVAPAPGAVPDAPDGPDVAEPAAVEQPAARPAQQQPKDVVPEFKLFRFFDFNVSPNVTYRYRVLLWLSNPNQGVKQQFVEPAVAANLEKWRKTPFSEPSPPITVGGLGRAYLCGPLSPGRGSVEPYVTMIGEQFVIPTGVLATAQIPNVYRGQAVNAKGVTAHVEIPTKGGVQTSQQVVDIATDHFVIDMSGNKTDSSTLMLGSDLRVYVLQQLPPNHPVVLKVKPAAEGGEAAPATGSGFDDLLDPGRKNN